MAPTTRSQSSQPQHDEDEDQSANAAGPSTTENLEATIPSVNDSNSYQPEGNASNNAISSDSEPAPPLKFKSGKTFTWKKSKAHDTSYKPSKESDQSDDTDLSQDWDESPLDQPTWKTKLFETPQSQSAQKTSKKKKPKGQHSIYKSTFKLPNSDDDDNWEGHSPLAKKVSWQKSSQIPSGKDEFHQPKNSEQALPVTPVANTIGTMAKASHSSWPVTPQNKPAPGIPAPEIPAVEVDDADKPWTHGHKSLMPTIKGFDAIFQTTSKAEHPAAPRPSNGNTSKNLPHGVFKGPPKPPQPPKTKQEEATNDSASDDDKPPWMKARNRKRKMPEIPGFADIFSTDDKPPSKTVKPYSYFNVKPSKRRVPNPQIPKPEVLKPEIQKAIPKPNEPETKTSPEGKPPQFPAPQIPGPQFPNTVKLEPGLLKDRDWPPYPGTIYCKRCFYHDCFRAIKLRRHILYILGLLEDDKGFLYFLKQVLYNAAVKSPHLPKAFGQSYFYQQIPGDVTALALLDQVIRHIEDKLPEAPSTQTQAKISSSLEEICNLLNISDAQYQGITMDWFNSRIEIQRKLQEAGYSLPKVKTDAVRAVGEQIFQALDPLLGQDLSRPQDPYDDRWFTLWQNNMEVNISKALGVIDYKKSYAKLKHFKLPGLNCSYCVHSGAENKAKANRPYPRDLAADARIPWAESLANRYPGAYDKNGNPIPAPYVMTGPFANKPVTNAQEFLNEIRGEDAQEVSYGGIKFLVWKSGGDVFGGSSDVRFVLVKMWSLVEAIESLDFIPVEHAALQQEETAE